MLLMFLLFNKLLFLPPASSPLSEEESSDRPGRYGRATETFYVPAFIDDFRRVCKRFGRSCEENHDGDCSRAPRCR